MLEKTTYGTPDSFSSIWETYTEEQENFFPTDAAPEMVPSTETQDALKAFYDDIRENLQEKADEYVYLIKDAQAQEAALKTEAARLTAKAKLLKEKATKIKDLLKHAMETSDIPKIKTEKHTLNVQKPGGKAPLDIFADTVEGVPLIGAKYLQERTVTDVLSDVIRADLKAGIEIEGVCLAKRDKILVIK